MRTVIVTVGTRAAGKSTFCERVLAECPKVQLISRDKILIEAFGSTDISPYGGGHHYAHELMWKKVKAALKGVRKCRLILDSWNGCSEERIAIIKKLRELGAERIVAWYFVTRLECVEQWFWQKPGIAKISDKNSPEGTTFYSESAPRHDHTMFHKLARSIRSDGFDAIVRVNPLTVRLSRVLKTLD